MPNNPTNIQFHDITQHSVTLTWQDNATNESGYKIWRNGMLIKTLGKSSASYTDKGLQAHTKYDYIVKATDDTPQDVMVNSSKKFFGVNAEPLTFLLYNLQGGDTDWLGVFKKGATHDRAHLLAWTYTGGKQAGLVTVDKIFINAQNHDDGRLNVGRYEIVSFFDDSYQAESISYFDIKDVLSLHTTQDIYAPSAEATLTVTMSNAPLKENNKDWLAVFKEGAANHVDNIYAWKYSNNQKEAGGKGLPYGKITFNHVNLQEEGKYEVRFFADDDFNFVSKTSFVVGDVVDSQVIPVLETDDVKIYCNKDTPNAPVVIFLSGADLKIEKYTQLMRLIAQQGYYVIGYSDKKYSVQKIITTLQDAQYPEYRDTSKISIMGHSLGGSYIFAYMQALKDANLASKKDSVVALDGWFALGMTPNDMGAFHTPSLIMAFGGVDGIPEGEEPFQNPIINLAAYQLIATQNKAFWHLQSHRTHGYLYNEDNQNDYPLKQDLLRPIQAFLDYTLKGDKAAKDIAMRDNAQDVVDYLNSDLYKPELYKWKCESGDKRYNYCHLNNILSDGEK